MINKSKSTRKQPRKMPPAKTPEARENQMVSLAVDLAEQQLRDGTASSQIITHYLKIGSTKEKIEKEILQEQKHLISAKTAELKSRKKMEDIYTKALDAMRKYSGMGPEPDEIEDDA